MKIIGHIRTDFPEKFGAPRQSGLVEELKGLIEFEPEYRNKEAFRGLEDYSHIWVLWQFSESIRSDGQWKPTVKPPRLGGNRRMGVFATRSPFRPNPIGLSCVRLEKVCLEDKEPRLIVGGIDMMDGTPIYDIKPYLSYTDSRPEAVCGFADMVKNHSLEVVIPDYFKAQLPSDKLDGLTGLLSQDPRPAYITASERVYGVSYAGKNIRFTVCKNVLTVCGVE